MSSQARFSDFETLDEYKADLKAKALERKEKEAKTAKQNALVDKAVENASMEIADAMITSQARNMANDFAQRLQMQGMTVDQYLQYTGLTREALVDQMKPQAETRIKNRLVLEAIAKAENIEVSDEEVEAEMQKMADAGTLTTINAEKLDLSNVGPIASQIMKLHSDMTGLFVFYDVALGSVVGNEYNNTVQGIMAGNDPQEAFENFQQFFDENYEK